MAKWSRITELSKEEMNRLNKVTSKTKGMTTYGYRARVAVMLPVNLAEKFSKQSLKEGKSIGQVIVDNLKKIDNIK